MSKNISGLPVDDDYYNDVRMQTAKGLSGGGIPDIHMQTAKGLTLANDINMQTARGTSTLKGGALKLWERELIESPEVRRKATVAQLCASAHTLNAISR